MKLPQNEQEFKEMVWSKSKDHLDKYPAWFQKEFVDYWLTVPDCASKCNYFLLSKKDREKWSTLGRMATCKRMFYRNDPRFKEEKKPDPKSHIYRGSFFRRADPNTQELQNIKDR